MSGLPVVAYLKSSQVSTYPGRLLYLIRSKSIKAFIPFFLHLVVIIILTVPFFSWAEEPSRIELTPEEKAWLEEHPNVTFGFTDSFEPFLIRGVRDQHIGILVDLLKELNSQLGTHFALEVDSWEVILKKVKNKELGAVLAVANKTADSFGLLKTVPYYTVYPTFFAHEDAPFAIKSLDDLRGKSVAILAKAKVMENILEPYGSDVEISRHPDNLTALQMVFEGKVDLAFGLSTHSYYINKYGLLGVKPVHTLLERPSKVGMAVRTDWPELVSILNKSIIALHDETLPRIINKWFGKWPQVSAKKVHLTPEEKAWLAQNHTIRVRFNQHPPYFYLKDDKVVGLAVDLLNKVSQYAGITFQQEGQSHFSDLLKGLIEHTGPDVVSAIMPTPKREEDILFTESFITSPRFIFTRDNAPFVSSIENLFGKKVAVVNGYVTHSYLAKNYPNINLLVYNTADEALRAVSSGKATAYIGDLISTPAIINEFGLKNLKAASPSGLPDHPLAMGVRNDWPELRDILDKALDVIPAAEKAAIINKWTTVKIEHGIRPIDTLKWVLIIVGTASGIVLIFVVWNKQLSSKVNERTSQLMETESRFRATFEQVAVGIAHVSLDGKFLRVNQKFCDITGYTEDEMLSLTFQDITHPDDLDGDLRHVQQVLTGQLENYSMDKRYFRKGGSIIWINLTVSLLFDKGGNPQYFVSVIKDISDRKQAEGELKKTYQEIEKLQKQLQAESAYLQEEIRLEHNFENIIGNSNAIQYALFKVEQVAETDSGVLILGETGTGKELIARAIHHNSQRHDRPLIKINCATLPANLIESELFGHEKGSFTGAAARHMGRFEVADGSTLFLDEIGELPLELQAKLLRAIEDGEFERLGSTKTIKVDVRIIAATNRELEKDVKEGKFREDLWYRLNVFPITLPPLRDRVTDIPLIVQYYLDLFSRKMGKKTKSIPTKFMETLQSYTWPGNVRELQNVIERAVISTAGAKLHLPEEFIRMDQAASTSENFKPLRDMERDYILSVLEKTGWKVSGKNSAAEILGLDRSTLRARMKKLGISK